jgi:hypothetical protein
MQLVESNLAPELGGGAHPRGSVPTQGANEGSVNIKENRAEVH